MPASPPEDPEEDGDAPATAPEYGDLLDAEWLERSADVRERDDDLVDVGLTLDLDERDAVDEIACVVDLDVGTLLTSLPPPHGSDSPELADGTLAISALRELLMSDERAAREHLEDDEEIGDDDHFPAFDASTALPSVPPDADDAEGEA